MKAKKFSRKLLALFLAVLMAMSCFSGVMVATAANTSANTKYHDDDLDFNSLGWPILNSEQACTALLDFADAKLAEANIADMNVDLSILGTLTIKLGSVDEILATVQQLDSFLSDQSFLLSIAGGDAKYVRLDAVNGMSRSATSSTDIVRGIVKLVRNLSSNAGTKGANGNIVKKLLRGELDLGFIDNFFNVYTTIGDLVGMSSGYQSNMVYNIVQQLVLENTGWFTQAEKTQIRNNPSLETSKLDYILLDKLSTNLLSNITAQITYADGTNSQDRYAQYLEEGSAPYIDTANLHYVTQEDHDINGEDIGNVYLFRYQSETLELKPTDTLFSFGYKAFEMVWHTALKDTLGQLNSGVGGYDYDYYMWYTGSKTHNTAWDYSNVANNYQAADVTAWAQYMCDNKKTDKTTAADFLDDIKADLEKYNSRDLVEDPTYTWRDIDSTTLFNKLRYSPLSVYYFKQETGPLNASFAETGMKNIEAFMNSDYSGYSSMLAALNDFLVAAVKDFLPNYDATALSTVNSEDPGTVAQTLVGNMLKVLQYICDATDKNILGAFYHEKGDGTALTEANLESAMIPFAISALRNIPDFKKGIHNEDLDACDDAEGVAALALQLYLGYVLPDHDYSSLVTKGEDGKYDVTMDSLLLMARDAVGYVMSPYVVLHDNSGKLWDPETATLSDGVTLFDLLNSVVVYYAGTDTFADGEQSKGVANMLGVCDTNGNCLVKLSNNLWQNIDAIVNKLLPVAGTLQYGTTDKKGALSSYQLIYEDVISGMLDIGVADSDGLYGATGFVTRLLTIVSAPPIKETGIIRTVYDLLADLVNAVFGGRYGTTRNVVPAAATNDHPFDDLLQKDTFAGTSSDSSYGVLGTLVYNVYEASGGVSGDSGKTDTVMPGLMYTVQAVNSLLGGFITTLADHNMKLASARVENSNVTMADSSTDVSTNLVFTNNCYGLNRAVKNSEGKFVARGRYNVQVTNAVADNSAVTVNFSAQTVEPEKTASFAVSTKGFDEDTVITYTVTYNIIDTNTNQAIYTGLTCKAYQFITPDKSWSDSVYPGGSLDSNFTSTSNTNTSDGAQSLKVSSTFGTAVGTFVKTNPLTVTYPEQMVVSTSDLSAVSDYKLCLKNAKDADRTMDGMYTFKDATVQDSYNNKSVTVNSANAIALCDPVTGDLLNYKLVDYTTDGGETWVKGVTASQVPSNATSRVNHAYTLAQVNSGGALAAAVKNSDGYYTAVYLKNGSGDYTYSNLMGKVSLSSGIDGFYIQTAATSLDGDNVKNTSIDFLQYDGQTDVSAMSGQSINVCFYSTAKVATASISLTVSDGGDLSQFNSAYSALDSYIKSYRPSDFKDYANGSSATYEAATAALAAGYEAKVSPLNADTASVLSSEFARTAVTSEVKTVLGEPATQPVTDKSQLPAALAATATTDGTYFYADKAMSQPYYNTTALTDSDVTGKTTTEIGGTSYTTGKDATGQAVVKSGSTWYFLNTQVYATAWDTDTYEAAPYAINGAAKEGAYNQAKFTYYNANGVAVSKDYTVKHMVTQKAIVNNGSETRALAMQARDKMLYAVDQCAKMLSVTVAGQIYTNVSSVRDNMTDANFNLPEYKKMVSVAKDAEAMYSADIYLTADETKTVLATCAWNEVEQTIAGLAAKEGNDASDYTYAYSTSTSSLLIEEAIRMFSLYMGTVTERGYIGDKVEAEVSHASGSAYTAMTTTWTDSGKTDEDGKAIQNAAIATTATTAKYGAVEGGQLVNKGEKVYTDESWTNYVNALAAAVDVATTGNGDYAHKDAATYVPADKDNYTANLSACFTAYKNLVDAENSLEEATAPAGFAVTGKVLALASDQGELATDEFTVIGCDVIINGETVATTGEDGTFTIPALAAGTYTATLSYAYGYDRDITITVTDGDVDLGSMGMVVCNYSKDEFINAADYAIYFASSGATNGDDSYNAACDFNHDGYVNSSDYAIYNAFSGAELSSAVYG